MFILFFSIDYKNKQIYGMKSKVYFQNENILKHNYFVWATTETQLWKSKVLMRWISQVVSLRYNFSVVMSHLKIVLFFPSTAF